VTGKADSAMAEVRPWSEATADQMLRITEVAFEELAIAQALVMMHGQERGARRYAELGGHVRFDEAGEPVVFHDGEWWRIGP